MHHLVSALGGGPADVFGSSGGAVVGLALVTARPGQVRTLVAHEPPVVELLPDSTQRPRPDLGHLRHLPGRRGGQGDAEVPRPRRPHAGRRPAAGRAALAAIAAAGGPDARQHRSFPCPPDPAHHAIPPRHRGTARGADPHRGRRRGHVNRATRQPFGRGTRQPSSARRWPSSPATTADSWPRQSSSAANWPGCSARRADRTVSAWSRVTGRHGPAAWCPPGRPGSGEPPHDGETTWPGLVIVPRGHHQVMTSTVSRPARTAGSASASSRARAREPVR